MNYNTIEITPVPFGIEFKMKDHFGKESVFMLRDEEVNSYILNQPGDYYVINNREEPIRKCYVRNYR